MEIERGVGMPKRKDWTGQRFGRLVAVSFIGRKHHNAVWLFRCDCGSEHGASISNVARQDRPIRSCGCLYCEVAGKHVAVASVVVQFRQRKLIIEHHFARRKSLL